jgi:hypothetical protein
VTMESSLQALLVAQCDTVWRGVAPAKQTAPFVTWQEVGGRTLRYVDNTAADKRNTLVQINAWASSSSAAATLIRAIEDALAATTSFVAEVQGEALATYEEDTKLFGAIQRYSITATR